DLRTGEWVAGTVTALCREWATVTTDAGLRVTTHVSRCRPLPGPGTDDAVLPPLDSATRTEGRKATRPVYLVCVFHVYAGSPDAAFPGETPRQRAERRRRYHYLGFTADEALDALPHWCRISCDHNWTQPVWL